MKSHRVAVKFIICYSWWTKFDHAGFLLVWKKCMYFYIRYRSRFFFYKLNMKSHMFAVKIIIFISLYLCCLWYVCMAMPVFHLSEKNACEYVLCMHVSFHFNLFRNSANFKLWNMIYFLCIINNPNEGAIWSICCINWNQKLKLKTKFFC